MSVGDGPFSPLPTRTSARHYSSLIVDFWSTISSSSCQTSQKEQSRNLSDLPSASINTIGRGRELLRGRWGWHDANSPSFSSPDPDYSLDLGQILVEEEGVFRSTRSRVAKPYNYEQPSSSIEVISPESLKSLFQWSDDEGEASGYASSATVSSVRTGRVLVHMVDNGNDDLCRRMEPQEQTSKAQQEALDNIQQMLAQLLSNRNDNDAESNHNEEEHNDDEQPKTKKSKQSSSIKAEVLKGFQA